MLVPPATFRAVVSGGRYLRCGLVDFALLLDELDFVRATQQISGPVDTISHDVHLYRECMFSKST